MQLSTILTVLVGIVGVDAVKFTLNTFQDNVCSVTTGNYNIPQTMAGQCISFEGPAASITFSSTGPNKRKCHLNVYLLDACSQNPAVKSKKAIEGTCIAASDFDFNTFKSAKVVCAVAA